MKCFVKNRDKNIINMNLKKEEETKERYYLFVYEKLLLLLVIGSDIERANLNKNCIKYVYNDINFIQQTRNKI